MEPPRDAPSPPDEPPPDAPGPPEAEAAVAPPEPPGCPRCGAPHDAFQEYCLECGARLAAQRPPGFSVWRRETWARDSPIWFWATFLALLLIALVAAVIVLAATGNDEEAAPADTATETQPPGATAPLDEETDDFDVRTDPLDETDTLIIPPTNGTEPPTLPETDVTPVPPPVPTPPTPPTPPAPTPPTPTPPPTPLPPPAPTPPPTPPPVTGDIRSWSGSGYTVIIASIRAERGRGPAERVARQAIADGLSDVGVLNSTNYSSLVPGYWATFVGVHTTLAEARAALPNVRQRGYPNAYVREVRP